MRRLLKSLIKLNLRLNTIRRGYMLIYFNIRMLHYKIKLLFLSVLCFLTAYLIGFHVITFRYLRNQEEPGFKVKLDHIVVHLDMKGSPPKMSYLKSLMQVLKEHNVNGLLVEYEDMFPYSGQLQNLSARNAYGQEELEDFLRFAVDSGFEVIPLIQTFGHLEHALKLEEFKHLREMPQYPDSICPSKIESVNFLKEMLEQVIKFHTTIAPLKYIHVGCDEVFHMNSCGDCTSRSLSNINIFIEHIVVISNIIQQLSPDTTILIWNDMLKDIVPDDENHLRFPNIIPVYWDYNSHDIFQQGYKMMHIQKWIFGRTWAATAFKGADGVTNTLPNIQKRFVNHYNWLKSISNLEMGNYYRFEGIILTGWSRYNHMLPPCELLPASIPSLILNLILIQKFQTGVTSTDMNINSLFSHSTQKLNKILNCRNNNEAFKYINCQFAGSDLYDLIHKYVEHEESFSKKIGSRYEARVSEHGTELKLLQQGYFDVNQIPYYMTWCGDAQSKLGSLEDDMRKVMSKYFDNFSVDEYVSLKMGGMQKDLDEACRIITSNLKIKVWPRRPFIGTINYKKHRPALDLYDQYPPLPL